MDTNPPEVSAEGQLEAIFAKQYGEAPETPAKPESKDEPEEREDEEAEPESSDDDEAEPEGEETEAKAEDESFEEVEFEGKAYKLPKELKDALLRQSDYTRKTQDVASKRRELEEREQFLQVQEQIRGVALDKIAEARALQQQLAEYEKLDWARLAEENPTQYLQLDRQQRSLAAKAQALQGEVQQLSQAEMAKVQEYRAQVLAKGMEELKRDLPSFGPELVAELRKTGERFGFSEQELASVVDPRMVKILHAAHQWQKLQGSKGQASKKVQEAKPMKTPAARAAESNNSAASVDKLKARARQTGSKRDVESFLEARFAKAFKGR